MPSYYDIPNFEEVITQKITYYYMVATRLAEEMNSRYPALEGVKPLWDSIGQRFQADPIAYPSQFPTEPYTLEKVNTFYARCDTLCDVCDTRATASSNTLITAYFAAVMGSQFIIGSLLGNDLALQGRVCRKTSQLCMEVLCTPEDIRAMMAGESPTPASTVAHTVAPGDILRYRDVENQGTIHTIRIKDHVSSAMKGMYYIVTNIIDEEQDDGSADQEVPRDVMAEWVDSRDGG
ncbi:hypothetical protein BYT27DRAFT_7202305 [Phlegmacium glaucopus]|nr:hypothetical protein BYT27DRAFT_7202305 [Phlegmacium glaucopus]